MERVTRLSVVGSGRENAYTLRSARIEIGRGSQNDVVVLDPRASRHHARLTRRGDNWEIEDLASANGTRLNGQFVSRAPVAEGDAIEIGDTRLTLRWVDIAPAGDAPTLLQATLVENELQLEHTLHDQLLESSVPDTTVPRLAARLEGRVWEIPLLGERLTIGRSPENDVVIVNDRVSRHHAALERRGERIVLTDLGSSNGTYLGEERVAERELRGDEDIRIGGARLVFKPAMGAADFDEPPAPADSLPRQPVVVVPGFMGTQLWRGDELVWPNFGEMIRHPDTFVLPEETPLTARGIVNDIVVIPGLLKLETYTRLVSFLTESLGYTEGKDLLVLDYDWRKDLRIAARSLSTQIAAFRAQLPDPSHQVTILAHSMGCLVTRYYIDRLDGAQAVARCVLMGGPQQGVPHFVVTILGNTTVMPFSLLGDRVGRVVSSFPSVYQALPVYPCIFDEQEKPIDLFADDRWLSEGSSQLLRDGKAFRDELGDRARVPTICIFGYGVKTVTKLVVQVGEDGRWHNPRSFEENSGDNTIPETSAILTGADIHPVQQQHGTLFTDPDVRMRLKLELTKR